jgi:WD40 repeat protein
MADFQTSVARIHSEDQDGVLGAGFLVGPDLLVTCAHVVEGGGGQGPVRVTFPQAGAGAEAVTGRLVPGTWRAPEAEDVAFLRLDPPPAGVPVLGLRSAPGPVGSELRTFGFPAQAPPDGHPGTANVGAVFTSGGVTLLGLTEANALAQGFSGSPIVDDGGRVVGMVTAHPGADGYGRGIDLAYATPATVLQRIGPDQQFDVESPYPGLVPFSAAQAQWFHGRTEAVDALLDRLRARRGVLALFGPSGSGKSSLIAAGLLPALVRGAFPGVTPSNHRLLRAATDPAAALDALTQMLSGGPSRPRFLILDQFEELLQAPALSASTGTPAVAVGVPDPSLAGQIFDALLQVSAGDDFSRVLLILRDDFFPRMSSRSPGLMEHLLQGRIVSLTDELTPAALREIIVRPADEQGWNVDPLLTDRLVRDLVDPRTRTASMTDLPVLALTLRRIWDTATASASPDALDNTLTPAHYDSVGGVRTAFATWCDQAYRDIRPELQPTARALVTALVQDPDLSQGTPAVRRRRSEADLTRDGEGQPDPRSVEVLDYLIEARIVTTNRDPGSGAVMVELAHDTVIENWEALHTWLEEDRDQRRWLDRTEDRAQHWHETGRRGGLLEDEDLAEAARWSTSRLPDQVAAFLRASRVRRRARARTRRIVQVTLVALTVLSLAAAGIAYASSREAQRQRAAATAQNKEALRQRDVAIANQALDFGEQVRGDGNAALAAQLDLVGYRLNPTPDGAARLLGLARSPLAALLPAGAGATQSLAISPDGRTLVGGQQDGTVKLWNLTAPAAAPVVLGHPGQGYDDVVNSVAFSPDGKTLAAGSAGKSVQLWNLTDRARPVPLGGPLTGPGDAVNAVAFSPDGLQLAAGDDSGRIVIWNLAGGSASPVRSGKPLAEDGSVYSVAFSPDGKSLLTGGMDGLQLWNLARSTRWEQSQKYDVGSALFSPDGRLLVSSFSTDGDSGDPAVQVWKLTGSADPVRLGPPLKGYAVAFAPDGRDLAVGSADDGTVQRWDLTHPANPVRLGPVLNGPTSMTYSLRYSPDGGNLAAVDNDGTVRVWNLASPSAPGLLGRPLTGPDDIVTAVAFSPDGHSLVGGSSDRTVRLWDPARPVSPGRPLTSARASGVTALAYSPDGRILACGGDDGKVRLWDLSDPAHPVLIGRPLSGHTEGVESVAFSPDGRTLASGGDDSRVRLWTLDDPAHPVLAPAILKGRDSVYSVAFSPDGRTLAGGSGDGKVRLWNLANPDHPQLSPPLAGPSSGAQPPDSVTEVRFSPNGKTLAEAESGGTIRLWNLADPARPVAWGPALTEPDSDTSALAFSPDGRTLAFDRDESIRLWNVSDPARPSVLGRPLTGHTDLVETLAFSPDGRTLASGSDDHTVRLWDLDVRHAISLICTTTSNILTPDQWRLYLPQLPYNPPCP